MTKNKIFPMKIACGGSYEYAAILEKIVLEAGYCWNGDKKPIQFITPNKSYIFEEPNRMLYFSENGVLTHGDPTLNDISSDDEPEVTFTQWKNWFSKNSVKREAVVQLDDDDTSFSRAIVNDDGIVLRDETISFADFDKITEAVNERIGHKPTVTKK